MAGPTVEQLVRKGVPIFDLGALHPRWCAKRLLHFDSSEVLRRAIRCGRDATAEERGLGT